MKQLSKHIIKLASYKTMEITYNSLHKVAICRRCKTCIVPDGPKQWAYHLRAEPHRMKGAVLEAQIQLLLTLELRGREELTRGRPSRREACKPVDGLERIAGYLCKADEANCDYATARLNKMRDHMPAHSRKAMDHTNKAPLWQACTLQTYFKATQLIDYFVVVDQEEEGEGDPRAKALWPQGNNSSPIQPGQTIGALSPAPTPLQRRVFERARADARQAKQEADEKATAVEGPSAERRNRERWLMHTCFPQHLQGLKDVDIQLSYKLPKGGEEGKEEDDAETELAAILRAVESWLQGAYSIISDRSEGRMMTQQRAIVLSSFAAERGDDGSRAGRIKAFRAYKAESTLASYFRQAKQLVAYFYRVAYTAKGFFQARAQSAKVIRLPEEVMEPTARQIKMMDEIREAIQAGSKCSGVAQGQERLDCAIREFLLALICQDVSNKPFRSPVLSFCAMLSRTRLGSTHELRAEDAKGFGNDQMDRAASDRKARCKWHDPGNYNSHLSALIWVAQMVLFEVACSYERDDDEQVLGTLKGLCRNYMHQGGETTFGHMLQWRLYISSVARSFITRQQARWSLCGQRVVYLGISLQLSDITRLIAREYQRALGLLKNQLLFQANDVVRLSADMLYDDLDNEEAGESWLADGRNLGLLAGSEDSLLQQIEGRADLRDLFLQLDKASDDSGELELCSQAIAVYEASVQEFLQSLLVLLFISPMPPLRAPEFLSIMFMNSSERRRSLLIWGRMLMIHVRYRKTIEQTGKDGDNVRFVPQAIAELVLTFLAIVQPLRQVFLRQSSPKALLSPYLFSQLNGAIWRDEAVSKSLSKACLRSEVPEFRVAWWRQVAASITKQKFSQPDQVLFNSLMDLSDEQDNPVAGEQTIVTLAEASNHSFRTFNYSYAGSTTVAIDTLLHRAFQASASWRGLFGFDEALSVESSAGNCGSKRPWPSTDPSSIYTSKKLRIRARPKASEGQIILAAQKLYNNPSFQLRRPGQRDAILAVLGPQAAREVVVVLATGTGKSLIAMIAAELSSTGTTILVLPTVALRMNMMERLARFGIRAKVWVPTLTGSAPIVIASAEGACSSAFLDYAHRLDGQQRLNRIIIDECHLTITARYRKSMMQLGSFIRQVDTQTVWLTATLPPVFEEAFLQRNMLTRPRIIRESTNRPNIRYRVQTYKGPGVLSDKAAELAESLLATYNMDGADTKARMIIYCPTLDVMEEIGSLLKCPIYTGDREMMSDEDKEKAIQQWLGPEGQPIIAATSALGVGFDYPHIRWVVHAGAPRRMTDLSQESGRAGRDGRPADTIVLLSAAWEQEDPKDMDERAMQLYLSGKTCLRAIMSQFLDKETDWRWCMEGEDELCSSCPIHHTKPWPAGQGLEELLDTGLEGAAEVDTTGPVKVLQQAREDEERLARLEQGLKVVQGVCLLCCIKGKEAIEHRAYTCSQRHSWIKAKDKILKECKARNKGWIEDYVACFKCYMPQEICRQPDPEARASGVAGDGCQYKDMIIPLCYGAFFSMGPRSLIKKHFLQAFKGLDEYMLWLGETTQIGDVSCIQAILVVEMLLKEVILA